LNYWMGLEDRPVLQRRLFSPGPLTNGVEQAFKSLYKAHLCRGSKEAIVKDLSIRPRCSGRKKASFMASHAHLLNVISASLIGTGCRGNNSAWRHYSD